jgi:hypothetical protein
VTFHDYDTEARRLLITAPVRLRLETLSGMPPSAFADIRL